MKYSVSCICGFETPLVEDKADIDYDLLYSHQEFCKIYLALNEEAP